MSHLLHNTQNSLIQQAGLPSTLENESRRASDTAWVEVIQRMDEVYADLINSQVSLEDTNNALQKAYGELQKTHEDLKKAQQQLIQSEKMASLGRLVAGVAHELNNPISFVFSNMHALQSYHSKFRDYMDAVHNDMPKQQREELRKTLRIDRMMADIIPLIDGSMEGAERVSDIVKNLRKYATPQQQSSQQIELISVIKRALKWVLKATPQKLKVHEDIPESLKLINNEGYIHQILINLMQNAIDAMQDVEQPNLFISLKQTQKHIDIVIRDNGNGIDSTHIHDVFDPFFTTKPIGSGTGLGLSISLGLAQDQCQGSLKARNHPNGGAEFVFTLPLEYQA